MNSGILVRLALGGTPVNGWAGPARWCGLAALLVGLDYLTGPLVHFPALFLVPVALAARAGARGWMLALGVALPLARSLLPLLWGRPWSPGHEAVNAAIEGAVFVAFGFVTELAARQGRELQREVRVLSGLLPICSFCKRIRDDGGAWQPLETFISARSEADFTHGLCPECGKRHYGEYFRD